MKISARNSLKGKVEKVDLGVVTASVKIKIEEPGVITATITKEAVEDLGLAVGDEVMAIIKSSEVMIAKK
jgi:molybdopterin-binding protein